MQSVQKTDWQSFEFFEVEKKTLTTNIFGISVHVCLWITVLRIINRIQRKKIMCFKWHKCSSKHRIVAQTMKSCISKWCRVQKYYSRLERCVLLLRFSCSFFQLEFSASFSPTFDSTVDANTDHGTARATQTEIFIKMLETDEKMGERIEISVNFFLFWLSAIELNRMGYN